MCDTRARVIGGGIGVGVLMNGGEMCLIFWIFEEEGALGGDEGRVSGYGCGEEGMEDMHCGDGWVNE